MATTGASIQATQERRSLEASLYMPRGGDYRLTLYREVVLKDADGNVLAASRDDKPIIRMASQIAEKSVTVNGQQVTGAFAMAALAAFFDQADEEDQTPPAMPPAPSA